MGGSHREGCACVPGQVSPLDLGVWAATWACSLFISIDTGLLIGIALALLKLFYETAFPAVVLLPATRARQTQARQRVCPPQNTPALA